jgi:hypothetical protein
VGQSFLAGIIAGSLWALVTVRDRKSTALHGIG